MKKQICSVMLLLLILLTAVVPASAEEVEGGIQTRQCVAGLVQNDQAYMYLHIRDAAQQIAAPQLQLKMVDPDGILLNAQESAYLNASSWPIHYFVLLDCSVPVANYRDDIQAFVLELLAAENGGDAQTEVTLAGLGDGFRLLLEDCADRNTLAAYLETHRYTDQNTDLYSGVLEALAYIQTKEHRAGELFQLILITDGKQDVQGETLTVEQLTQLEQVLQERQDVILHTFGLGNEWDSQELRQAEFGRGCHLSNAEATALEAGTAIRTFTNELYVGHFVLPTVPEADHVRLQVLYDGGPSSSNVLSIPVWRENAQTGKTRHIPEAANKDPRLPASVQEVEGASVGSAGSEEGGETEERKGAIRAYWFLLPVLLLLLILVVYIWRVQKRSAGPNKTKEADKKARPPLQDAIHVKIRVVRGTCKARRQEFDIHEELRIGSSPTCELVFEDAQVSAYNSRIFVREQQLYIEDMGSRAGTSIGGMRIHAPNRLRSGDQITIGKAVQFQIEY